MYKVFFVIKPMRLATTYLSLNTALFLSKIKGLGIALVAKRHHFDIGNVAVTVRGIVENNGTTGPIAIGWFGARRVVLEDNAWRLCGSTLFQGGVCELIDKTFDHEVAHTLPTSISFATNTHGLRHTYNNTTNLMRQGRQDPDSDMESEYPDERTAVRHTADRIIIEMPNSVRGAKQVPIRIQALTSGTPAEGAVILNKLDVTREENGAPLRLRFPKFRLRRVGPGLLFTGGPATVTMSGLVPDKGVHVVFGTTEVATGTADNNGDFIVSWTVPALTTLNSHLVTVATVNTALTADCIAEVAESKVHYEYTAKFICGVQEKTGFMRLARGFYATTVNKYNPKPAEARLPEKIALAYPPASLKPGLILPVGKQRFKYDDAAIDCDHIRKKVFSGKFPADYIDGYLVIQSDKSLDVDKVHTTVTLNTEVTAENHSSIFVNRVSERVFHSSPPSQTKSDLLVMDINLASLEVRYPNGPGSCVTSVKVTVENVGPSDVTGFYDSRRA